MNLLPETKDFHYLLNRIAHAIDLAFIDPAQHEPQLVANLVWHLPNSLNGFRLLSGETIHCGGVFVHTQPQVKCEDFPKDKPRSVEIGDLLLLSAYVHGGRVLERRAMLLQAKVAKRLPVSPDNPNQYHLYANWPPFEYVRSSRLNGKKRHITGYDLYNASKYLLIGDNLLPFSYHYFPYNFCPSSCAVTAQPTEPDLSHHTCFCYELTQFITGDSGKTYDSPPQKWTRNWDRVIEDLTTETAKKYSVYMGRASSGINSSRGNIPNELFTQGSVPKHSQLAEVGIFPNSSNEKPSKTHFYSSENNDEPPNIPEHDEHRDEESGGISIIEFVVESKERTND